MVEEAAIERIEGEWFATSRYQRRARVTRVETLTTTGTVRLAPVKPALLTAAAKLPAGR